MKIGVVFPQTEIGADAGGVKEFAQSSESLGYSHLLAYDHVLGASTQNRPDFSGPYTSESMFHEIFVLFGYLAGITSRLELVSGVVILPQRQTALVAKQAAEIDVLTGGQLRLGIGVGWNEVEFVGLNETFADRGRRSEEQIEVMRALWTDDVVNFSGVWHDIPEAGLNPLPVQRPIPVWIGGYVKKTMERIGRMGDGWFPGCPPGERLTNDLKIINDAAIAAGRDPSAIGMEGRIKLTDTTQSQWGPQVEAWREAGASHLSIVTMDGGLSPAGHIELLERFRSEVSLN